MRVVNGVLFLKFTMPSATPYHVAQGPGNGASVPVSDLALLTGVVLRRDNLSSGGGICSGWLPEGNMSILKLLKFTNQWQLFHECSF